MASAHHIIITFLVFAKLLFLGDSSSHDQARNNFLDCLINQFQRSNLGTDVIYTPQNATYASLLLAFNLRPQSTSPERPSLIVTPFHVSEIQAAIHCSKELGLQIRVRSGGHDYEGLSYTSSVPFLIVDMRNFRSIRIHDEDEDENEKTAWVQVGATLGQLYRTISLKSKTLGFPAGSCPTVGVGGHFSGGGYSMMSRKHALAADHIVDAKLINADGEVLDRKTMGEDLFWAIRGGGAASFGIVLEFKVKLVTVPEIVTVFEVKRTLKENATELVHRWQHIADTIDENLVMRVLLGPEDGTIVATLRSLYLGQARDLLPLMKEQFPELGLVEEDCIEMSWIESVIFFALIENDESAMDVLADRTPQGGFLPIYFKGKSDFVTVPIPVEGLREIWRFLLEEEASKSQLLFSPWGGVLNGVSESETPFPHRKGNIFMIHYVVAWNSRDEPESRMDWIRRLYSFMERYVSKTPRAAYFNYKDLDIGRNSEGSYTSYGEASVWGLCYYKNNFRRLVRVKTKVDPSNFFRNEQSIPPLISLKNSFRSMNLVSKEIESSFQRN